MKKEIDKKILSLAIMTVNEYSSICAMNTILMIEEKGIGLFDGCAACIFKDMIGDKVCPSAIKKDIRGLI